MKILTVCNGGNCRSVTLASMLKQDDKSVECLSIGVRTSSKATFRLLANWADKIVIVADGAVRKKFPEEFIDKLIWLDIGKDKWEQAMNPNLVKLIQKELKKTPLLKSLKVRTVLKAS